MFAIFHHYTQWSWDNLPNKLTESVHMTLDTPTCMDDSTSFNDTDMNTRDCAETSEVIPVHTTQGTQIYRLRLTAEPNLPPMFHSIAKAGVEDFKRSTKKNTGKA